MRRRFFQIGFNRCGTASLHRFFRLGGIPSVHHDGGRLAIAMDANLRAGRFVLTGYEEYDAFLDMSFLRPHIHVEIHRRWEVLLEQVPEARFILNLRDTDRWVASRLAMGAWTEWRFERPARGFGPPWDIPPRGVVQRIPPFRERYRLCHGLADLDAVAAHWREDWTRHTAAVRASVPADRLLAFDVESGPPERLCEFVGLGPECARFWSRENAAMNPLGRFLSGALPVTVKRNMPEGWKRAVRNRLARRGRDHA